LNFDEYQVGAFRTCKQFGQLPADLAHMSLGLATESGEFTTVVKRAAIYDKPIDAQAKGHMLEELGDILWYVAGACSHLGESLEEVAANNLAKLKLRFPEKYSNEAAEGRADKGGLDARSS
jgi:NTP pyrophosphatase (non-canonical NTP hydrolase)